jgi:hypothetical protein
MSLYHDEEMDIHLMESGYRFQDGVASFDPGFCAYLPDIAISVLAEFACEYLTDQLTFSLLSSQHRRVLRAKLLQVSTDVSPVSKSALQTSNLAEYFTNWSLIRFGGNPSFITNVESSQSALSFYCKSCHQLIITQNEVDSPHYHGGYGPAFLAHRVFNCHHSADEAYETQFTTGVYRVCDVTCFECGARVGKKYIEARDPANFFKVGKILLEQTLLTMPKCCNNRRLNAFPPEHYFCSRESGVSCFCSVCFDVVRYGCARAVLEMTRGLEVKHTMKLLSLLIAERQVLTNNDQENIISRSLMVSSPAHNLNLVEDTSPSISRRFGDVISMFVRRSISSSEPASPSNSDLLELGSPKNASMNPTMNSSSNCSKFSPEQLTFLSQSIGSRISMMPDYQNWILSTKFVSDVVTSAAKQGLMVSNSSISLSRVGVLESFMSQCDPVSFHSATLLLSRVQNSDDRKAIVTGLTRNPKNILTAEELHGLVGLTGTACSSPTSGRWSFSSGSAYTSSHR